MREKCDWHIKHNMGYLQRMQWFEDMHKAGHRQTQCKECYLWLYRCEQGKDFVTGEPIDTKPPVAIPKSGCLTCGAIND